MHALSFCLVKKQKHWNVRSRFVSLDESSSPWSWKNQRFIILLTLTGLKFWKFRIFGWLLALLYLITQMHALSLCLVKKWKYWNLRSRFVFFMMKTVSLDLGRIKESLFRWLWLDWNFENLGLLVDCWHFYIKSHNCML